MVSLPFVVSLSNHGHLRFASHRSIIEDRHMSHITIDIDDAACAEVMRRYRFASKREAVNFALRTLAGEASSLDEARAMRGAG